MTTTVEMKIFPGLPSLRVAAMVLSYARYDDQVRALLNLLCLNTRLAAETHQGFNDWLGRELRKWRPRVAKYDMIEFGHKGSPWDSIYPTKEQMRELPVDKRIKLRAIRYKCVSNPDVNSTLSGIELLFTNGVGTPMFDTEKSTGDGVKTVQVDPARPLTRIDVKVWADEIYGLRLVEKPGVYAVNEMWNTRNAHIGRWESFRIPEQLEIIGVQCSRGKNSRGKGSEHYISRLGFLLWRPNPAVPS